jgi:cobalt/nickel transport system ATP-binding protein
MGQPETDQPVLRVNRLSHAYADGRPVLSDISFDVLPGQCIAVIGPNGAGKTTLFLRICGVLLGQVGAISVNGLDPAVVSDRRQLPASVGIVFQNPDEQLFSPTVIEDVAFGPLNLGLKPDDARQRALEALEQIGIASLAERAPHRLSGGEKRKAAIAGVLAMRPVLYLFDEPTSFLDHRGRRELRNVLKNLAGSQIIATHDEELIRQHCAQTLVLERGKVLAFGPSEAILGDVGLREQLGMD